VNKTVRRSSVRGRWGVRGVRRRGGDHFRPSVADRAKASAVVVVGGPTL
jgi:hypothetical protein